MRFRTRAKTAYGLLSEIRKLILEEPKRYNQTDLLNIRGTRTSFLHYEDPQYPACGTIGCVAGWATALTAPRPARVKDALAYAAQKLGLSIWQADKLFDGGAASHASQTPEHAAAGAAHITRFQRAHAAQLKRTKL